LLTGSRSWKDKDAVIRALSDAVSEFPVDRPVVLVHGACELGGADTIADKIWESWLYSWPALFDAAEKYPAKDFPDPKARNQFMVDLGAAVCLSFAESWASGSGHCARAARQAGIETIDFGVSTCIEDRPVAEVAA
jgi:hypothetical protein